MRLTFVLFCSAVFLRYINIRLLPVLNGFLAKHLCSAIFVSRRSLSEIRQHELKVSIFRLPTFWINHQRQSVTVSLWGRGKREAFYHPEWGCSFCREPPSKPGKPSASHRKKRDNPLPISRALTDIQKKMLCWMNTKPAQTLAVYALHRGKTLAEIYAPGIKRDTPLPGWSMAKSVVNALVGILVKEGRLKLHDPLPTQLWQGKRDGRSAISMHHLLQMSSGLPWTERYWWSSDVTRMLFTSEDVSQGITAKPYRMPPGDSWQYASGTTNVISKALRQLLGEAYHDFPYQHLFAPLGMHSALMETDACGNFVGSSYMLGSAADWAKLGLLYAQDGIWKGKRILPEGWVKYSTTPAASAPQREYGAHFWLNLGTAGRPETRKMPDVPGEVFYASGFGGQRIFIVPSQDLVIVRLGAAHFREPDFNALLSQLLADFSSNRIKF